MLKVLGGFHRGTRGKGSRPWRTWLPTPGYRCKSKKVRDYKTSLFPLTVSDILCWSSSKGALVPDPPASWLSALPSCIPSVSPKASSSLHSQLCKMIKISTQTRHKCPLKFVLQTSCLRPAGRFFCWLLGRGSGVQSGLGGGGRQFLFT